MGGVLREDLHLILRMRTRGPWDSMDSQKILILSLFVSFSHPRTLQSGLSPVPRSFVDRLVAYCSPACGFTTPRCSFHSCLYFIIVFHVHDVSPLSPPVHNIVTSIVFLYSRLAPRVLFFIYVRHRLFLVSYPRIGFIHEWM